LAIAKTEHISLFLALVLLYPRGLAVDRTLIT